MSPITKKVDSTEMIHVKNVMVETWQPRGRVLSSHRSDQSGQTSGLRIGAKICILEVFGMQVEDSGMISHCVKAGKQMTYRWAPTARRLI
jgi:hypothetical protein